MHNLFASTGVEGDLFVTDVMNESHLSKNPSDLKQKCTQLPTPFLGTVFHALSLGVIHFVPSVGNCVHFCLRSLEPFERCDGGKENYTGWKTM